MIGKPERRNWKPQSPSADARSKGQSPVLSEVRHTGRTALCPNVFSLNFSPIEKIKAALRGIKVVSSISYAKGEERPYGNRVYNRTNGISATGAAPSDREI